MSDLQITTRQEFRKAILRGAWRGMVIQGGAFYTRWRQNGCCCTVGWLIPDARLIAVSRDPKNTGGEFSMAPTVLAEPLQKWITASAKNHLHALSDLRALQTAHDGSVWNPPAVFGRLRGLASQWNVDLPLDEYPDPRFRSTSTRTHEV